MMGKVKNAFSRNKKVEKAKGLFSETASSEFSFRKHSTMDPNIFRAVTITPEPSNMSKLEWKMLPVVQENSPYAPAYPCFQCQFSILNEYTAVAYLETGEFLHLDAKVANKDYTIYSINTSSSDDFCISSTCILTAYTFFIMSPNYDE